MVEPVSPDPPPLPVAGTPEAVAAADALAADWLLADADTDADDEADTAVALALLLARACCRKSVKDALIRYSIMEDLRQGLLVWQKPGLPMPKPGREHI